MTDGIIDASNRFPQEGRPDSTESPSVEDRLIRLWSSYIVNEGYDQHTIGVWNTMDAVRDKLASDYGFTSFEAEVLSTQAREVVLKKLEAEGMENIAQLRKKFVTIEE